MSELERRISEVLRVGVVSEVQPEKGLCRVSFGERVSPLSPWFAARAGKDREFWHPDIGEQAVFFSPYGDGSEGFVLPGIFSNKMPLPTGAREGLHIVEYADGTRVEVDRNAHVVQVKDSYGSVVRMKNANIYIYAVSKIFEFAPDGIYKCREEDNERTRYTNLDAMELVDIGIPYDKSAPPALKVHAHATNEIELECVAGGIRAKCPGTLEVEAPNVHVKSGDIHVNGTVYAAAVLDYKGGP